MLSRNELLCFFADILSFENDRYIVDKLIIRHDSNRLATK